MIDKYVQDVISYLMYKFHKNENNTNISVYQIYLLKS